MRRYGLPKLFGAGGRHAEPDNPGHVFGAPAASTLLAAAKLHPLDRGSLAHIEHPNPLRTLELVRTEGEQINSKLVDLDR